MNSTENILSYWYDTKIFSPFWPIEDKNTVKITNSNSIKALPWENDDNINKYTYDVFLGRVKSQEPPSLYVISPFTSVISELKTQLKLILCSSGLQQNTDVISDWISKSRGTIHTFQGEEANEVIIVLGCDSNKGDRCCSMGL